MSATTKKYFFQIQFRLFLYPLARSVFDLRKVIDTQVGLLPPVSWDVPKSQKFPDDEKRVVWVVGDKSIFFPDSTPSQRRK